eukprot:scpid58408/ scgid12588/ 
MPVRASNADGLAEMQPLASKLNDDEGAINNSPWRSNVEHTRIKAAAASTGTDLKHELRVTLAAPSHSTSQPQTATSTPAAPPAAASGTAQATARDNEEIHPRHLLNRSSITANEDSKLPETTVQLANTTAQLPNTTARLSALEKKISDLELRFWRSECLGFFILACIVLLLLLSWPSWRPVYDAHFCRRSNTAFKDGAEVHVAGAEVRVAGSQVRVVPSRLSVSVARCRPSSGKQSTRHSNSRDNSRSEDRHTTCVKSTCTRAQPVATSTTSRSAPQCHVSIVVPTKHP